MFVSAVDTNFKFLVQRKQFKIVRLIYMLSLSQRLIRNCPLRSQYIYQSFKNEEQVNETEEPNE